MKILDSIPNQIWNDIKGKRWYRHGIYRTNFMQAAFIAHFHEKEWYRKEGIDMGLSNLIQLDNGSYIDEIEFSRLVKHYKKKLSLEFLTDYIKKYDQDNRKMLAVSQGIRKLDPRKMSNAGIKCQLGLFFEQSQELIHWLWSMEFLNPALDEYLKESISGIGPALEKDFLLLSYIPKKLDFQKEKEEIINLPRLTKTMVGQLHKKYDWLNMNFWDGLPFSIQEYQDRTERIYAERKNIKIKIAEDRENQKKFQRIIRKIGSSEIKRLVRIAQDLIFLKTERIDVFTRSWRDVIPLWEEYMDRFGLKWGDLYNMTAEEIIAYEHGGKNTMRLSRRRKYATVRISHKVSYYCAEAHDKILDFLENSLADVRKEFQGKTAYPGKVRGKIKVLMNDREINRIKKGDILVANLTNPNYDPAFPKLKAVITDEGGLLCHSAIMAREFKIPTVIGTKIATQVLHDGDEVEVDADAGVVRILKQSINKIK